MTGEEEQLARELVARLTREKLTLTTAESCTGGLIAATLTGIPGASAVLHCAWVTYCNEAKHEQLGVPYPLIEQHSVVSEPVVAAMALGALERAKADCAIAVSGNAGPMAAEGEPPVGTVCIAYARRGREPRTETVFSPGMERNDFRHMVVHRALQGILALI